MSSNWSVCLQPPGERQESTLDKHQWLTHSHLGGIQTPRSISRACFWSPVRSRKAPRGQAPSGIQTGELRAVRRYLHILEILVQMSWSWL